MNNFLRKALLFFYFLLVMLPARAQVITTIAGTGTIGLSGDGGQATVAQLSFPYSVGVDAQGNVYFSDYGNDRIRKINASTGIITTIAGTMQGFGGDGGLATNAQFFFPQGIALDAQGNII